MTNLATQQFNPILKSAQHLQLKPLTSLEKVNIFTLPSQIKERDISAMFNGLLGLIKEKVQQEQTAKYLQLKLKYDRLKNLYIKLKIDMHKRYC